MKYDKVHVQYYTINSQVANQIQSIEEESAQARSERRDAERFEARVTDLVAPVDVQMLEVAAASAVIIRAH